MANFTIGKMVTAMKPPLKELGFTHRKGNHFTKSLNDNVLAHIYLRPLRRFDGALPVSPHIGVRHEGLMKLVCDLVGAKLGEYLPVTLDGLLGNVITDGKRYGDGSGNGEWRIADADGLQACIPQMIDAIEKFGIPFLQANDNLSGIVETLIERFHFEGDLYEEGTFDTIHPYGYIAPAALFMLGRKGELGAFLEKQMQQQYKYGKGGWTKPYRIYTRRLLDLADEREGKAKDEGETPAPVEERIHSMVADSFDDLTGRLAGPLAALGFEPFGESRFRRVMNKDVRGTLWLFPQPDLSTKGFSLRPMVGVRHRAIADILAEISEDGEPQSEDSPASLLAPLFAIVPPIADPYGWLISVAKDAWPISESAVGGPEIDDFIADVRDYVIPFMDAHNNLESITDKLSAGLFDLHYMPGYMPAVALYLAGRYDDVLDVLQTALFRQISPDEDKNKDFRKFCRRMIRRMEADGWTAPRKRMKTVDAYIEESAPTMARTVSHQPLVKALDIMLLERGFEKHGRLWRRDAGKAVFGVYLDHKAHHIDHELEYGVWFEDRGGEPPGQRKDGLYGYHTTVRLPRELGGRLDHRMKRATQFAAGWDHAGKTQIQWDSSHTIPERLQALRDMDAMKPLTVEWRISVLHEVMEQVVFPAFDKIESGQIAAPGQTDAKGDYDALASELRDRRAGGQTNEALIDFLFDAGHPPMEAVEIWDRAFDPDGDSGLEAEMDAKIADGMSLHDMLNEVVDDAKKASDDDVISGMMDARWRAHRLEIWKRGL